MTHKCDNGCNGHIIPKERAQIPGTPEFTFDKITEWAKKLPESAWHPFPLPEYTKDRICAVRTVTGRVLVGKFYAFNPRNQGLIAANPKYLGCVSWVEAGD